MDATQSTTTTRRPGRPQSVTVRLEDRGYDSPCWIWQGSTNGNGYGTINREGFRGYAHRFHFLKEHGEIPEGFHLDHLCLQRLCCTRTTLSR
jgi:DNA-directed RNA polymerase subunit N (RpoN/RPB10)